METTARPAEGDLIDGRYRLSERLGEGSFGGVWRALDTRLADRSVAVKLLKPEFLAREDTIARFDAEANALAQVTHANVVSVIDRGTWSGQRYIVTEYIDGRPLKAWLLEHRARSTLPGLGAVAALFDQVCAGLEAAHAVRTPGPIVHRDLKPDNVLVRALPSGELAVKLVDFGIAQLGRRSGTQSGVLLGTPMYMAPEQAFGHSAGVGPWTDVFTLGVLLVELLTLRENLVDNEPWWGTVLHRAPVVRERLLALRLDVPVSVWEVALRCLEAHGPDRYPDASALRLAFRQAHVGFITAPGFAGGSALPGALSYVPSAPPVVAPVPSPVESDPTPAPPSPWVQHATAPTGPTLPHGGPSARSDLALARTVLAGPVASRPQSAPSPGSAPPWWKVLLIVVGVAILSAGLLVGAVIAYDLFLEPDAAPNALGTP
ncbi:MAG: serine/threonine protein kinase [Deltaproteobacteria bacterium]|nr:serine/threonine protein kinase [Deltaproteobacteria bacterium]